jgi:hypothetical protein
MDIKDTGLDNICAIQCFCHLPAGISHADKNPWSLRRRVHMLTGQNHTTPYPQPLPRRPLPNHSQRPLLKTRIGTNHLPPMKRTALIPLSGAIGSRTSILRLMRSFKVIPSENVAHGYKVRSQWSSPCRTNASVGHGQHAHTLCGKSSLLDIRYRVLIYNHVDAGNTSPNMDKTAMDNAFLRVY